MTVRHSGSHHSDGPQESRLLYALAVALVVAWAAVGAAVLVGLALRLL